MFLEIAALVVIILIVGVVIWLVVLFGNMPGQIARQRNHSQADAISALGWIGLITMGIGWFMAIVWAYYKPDNKDSNEAGLQKRINDLESQIEKLQVGGGES